jgi:universal stress protein C
MQEETREFLNELARHADYPIEKMTIACGELGHHIKDFCRSHRLIW